MTGGKFLWYVVGEKEALASGWENFGPGLWKKGGRFITGSSPDGRWMLLSEDCQREFGTLLDAVTSSEET